MNIFRKIYNYFFKLDVDKLEFKLFIRNIKLLKQYHDITTIDKVYNIYTGPIFASSYYDIVSGLIAGEDIKGHISLGIDSHMLEVNYTENKDKTKTLYVVRIIYGMGIIELGFVQTITEIPKFAIRNKLIYSDGYYYPTSNLATKEKISIDLNKL